MIFGRRTTASFTKRSYEAERIKHPVTPLFPVEKLK